MSGKGRPIQSQFEIALTQLSIRYAAPPTGSLRWQAPQAPIVNRSSVVSAGQFGAICPQNPDALGAIVSESTVGVSEDCLFLNVYAPKNATGPLPVMVWIHGGGYGTGSSVEYDLSSMINVNEGMFLGVTIQYRVCWTRILHSMGANRTPSLGPSAFCPRMKSFATALLMLAFSINISPSSGRRATSVFSAATLLRSRLQVKALAVDQ